MLCYIPNVSNTNVIIKLMKKGLLADKCQQNVRNLIEIF